MFGDVFRKRAPTPDFETQEFAQAQHNSLGNRLWIIILVEKCVCLHTVRRNTPESQCIASRLAQAPMHESWNKGPYSQKPLA
jgi:hypothetical protein